ASFEAFRISTKTVRLQSEAALFLPKSLKKAIALKKSVKKHLQNFVISKITATFALGNDIGQHPILERCSSG
uniref:hypothetical protein n=2 Tax=uncultured Muribaculum sp. TaxID=1918613 RepID=UPI0025B715F1